MTQPPWSYWLQIAQEIVLHANDEPWQAQVDRIARAANQAFSDGRAYEQRMGNEARVVKERAREYPEETGSVDLIEVE